MKYMYSVYGNYGDLSFVVNIQKKDEECCEFLKMFILLLLINVKMLYFLVKVMQRKLN